MDIFNDTIVQIVTVHMLCFTNFVSDPEVQYGIGFSMIFFISIIVLVNLGIIFSMIGSAIMLIFTRHKRIFKVAVGLEHINLTFPSFKKAKEKIIKERKAVRTERVGKMNVLERYVET